LTAQISPETLQEAAALWGGDAASLEHLGSSENSVYRLSTAERRHVLRLTQPEHRSVEQISAELAFITYLRDQGVRACAPIPSRHGRTIELLANEPLLASVFEEAVGERFHYDPDGDNRAHFRSVGRTLGRIHALSRHYAPRAQPRRFDWSEDPTLAQAQEYLDPNDDVAWREFDALMKWLEEQPSDAESFGLIHGDFGPTNYLSDGEGLSVFDFDDACYHWFAYDLAITIYPHGRRKEVRSLYTAVVEGYAAETSWDGPPLEEMVTWCRLRLLTMYLHTLYRWRGRQIPDSQADWLQRTRANIARSYAFHPDA
jgi:amicoumacin kinase